MVVGGGAVGVIAGGGADVLGISGHGGSKLGFGIGETLAEDAGARRKGINGIVIIIYYLHEENAYKESEKRERELGFGGSGEGGLMAVGSVN